MLVSQKSLCGELQNVIVCTMQNVVCMHNAKCYRKMLLCAQCKMLLYAQKI